jgi:peptidoglycan/xylan/chitin deacetylase (PgdA/CDA1 family)
MKQDNRYYQHEIRRWMTMPKIISFTLLLYFLFPIYLGQAATDRAAPILKIETERKVVAITFDDGPDPKYTPLMLEVLHKEGVQATFFVLGKEAQRNPSILSWMVRAGHEVANHGYSHPDMRQLNKAEVYTEIKKAEQVIKNATGLKPEYYRPPGGVVTPAILRAAFEAGYQLIHWSIDPKDWKKNHTAEVISGSLKDKVGAGDIILFHDGGVNQEETIKAVVALIHDLKEHGYQFVTVSQLLEME